MVGIEIPRRGDAGMRLRQYHDITCNARKNDIDKPRLIIIIV